MNNIIKIQLLDMNMALQDMLNSDTIITNHVMFMKSIMEVCVAFLIIADTFAFSRTEITFCWSSTAFSLPLLTRKN